MSLFLTLNRMCARKRQKYNSLKKISKFPFQYFRCSFSFRARHKVVGSSHVYNTENSIIDRSFRRRTALVSVQHSELLVNDNWNTENESVRRSEPCAVHRRLLDHANSLSAGTRSSTDSTPRFSLIHCQERANDNIQHKREKEVTEEIFIFGKKSQIPL